MRSETVLNYNPIPFDHTYILYDPNDILSIICVHFSLLPIYIMVFYTSWFLITREIEPVIIVGGHLANELANKIVKIILKQPRPDFHKAFGETSYSLSFGMPSAHSQFIGFFAAYFISTIIYQVPTLKNYQKGIGCIMLALALVCVSASRTYLLYHTIEQVLVGCLLGYVLGMAYFIVAAIVREIGLVDWILNVGIVRYFYIKDSYYWCYQTFEDELNHCNKLVHIQRSKQRGQ